MPNIKTIVIINGPNLNLLGIREQSIYGKVSFEDYLKELKDSNQDLEILYHQSNHEGQLIDWIQEYGFSDHYAIVLNAAGYTHTSIALMDSISAINNPVVEVHISNIEEREAFRKHSYVSLVATKCIMGKGLAGYQLAIDYLRQPSED